MANIIRVRIALKGTQCDIDPMYAKVATENNEFDFNAIIPCPAELAEFEDTKKLLGMSKEKSAELVSKYGFSSPYLWRMEHWGTKDNNRSEEVMGGAWFSEDIVELATSDCFPYPVLAELSKQFPNVDMDFIFADEDAGCNAGNGVLKIFSSGQYRTIHGCCPQIRLAASASRTMVQSGCICRMEAGTSGVTGPKKARLMISALPAPLATSSTLRACMMVLMPMV